jgi:mRNA interferase RelE/StbE
VARYKLFIKPSAVRELAAVPGKAERRRLVARIQALAIPPRPPGCEKLTADERYRLRQGRLRILYLVDDTDVSVTVVKVADRKDAYR